jgi:hypothetical protein
MARFSPILFEQESAMRHVERSRFVWALGAALGLIVSAGPAAAQNVTTGALSGVVSDQQGGVLPGVTVTATHQPTETKYEAVTGADGRYEIPNVRVGGPYVLTATLSGFKDATESNVTVPLGARVAVDLKMLLPTIVESVTVTAAPQVIDTTRAGTGANIPVQEIESLPTIARSITDIARINPLFNPTTLGGSGDQALSVAGRHNRYNNMQIDGAVNNDLFGLADTGTPGGQTGTQPISFDALQEIQLVVAPYDVKQGGFSGGGVNVVTKSGSNAMSGTAYMFARNQGLIGQIPAIATVANPSPADIKVGTFTDKQGGFSLGGRIVQNKAFYFGNLDLGRKNTPSGFSASGDSGQQWNAAQLPLVQQALSIIKNQYGFDPGGLDQFSKPNNSDKVFVRTDFNVNPRNQLTVRANYVNGLANVGTPTTTEYLLPDRYYSIQDKVLSSVGQLNTTISSTAFNEFRLTYQRERNVRGDQPGFATFPDVQVDVAPGLDLRLGTEFSSQANKLNQDIVEINDDVTWLKGKHSISVGTHNELFHFYNLFIQAFDGSYRFTSVANLQQGIAQSFQHNFSNTSEPLQAAEFSVHQFGVYAGDQWRAAPNFTLTYGVRFDAPQFPDSPHANAVAVADFGYRTDVVPAPKMWSPRVGFNWDLSRGSDNRQQIRGGIGSYAGRTPYVWLSNQYGNTGVDFTSLQVILNANNRIAFVADPAHQPTSIAGGVTGKQTINMIDPNYKYPQILRGNLAYDRALGVLGLVGTAEFVWSKTQRDILYKNLNYVPIGTAAAPDGRLLYQKFDQSINDALLLTNTHQGDTETIVLQLERPFRNGFSVSGSYLYNRARSISDGGAFVALSTWRDQYVTYDANNPQLAPSIYQVGSRVQLTTTIPIPLGKGLTSYASFFYNGQNGQRYSLVYNGDANFTNAFFSAIAFLPSDPSQVMVNNGTYAQLDAYLAGESAAQDNRGKVPNRNTGVSPWSNRLDFRYAVNVPIPARNKAKVELTFDILNLGNLLNKNWGWVYYPNFNSPTTIGFSRYDAATGKPVLNLSTITSPTFLGTFSRDDLRSRWQAQWGARIRF